MKALLINPKSFEKGNNIGLAYLAASLKKAGHETRVLDFNNKREKSEERLAAGLEWGPGLIGISINTFALKEAERLAGEVKKKTSVLLVAGGPHVTIEKENFLKDSLFDAGVIGEGENTLVELAEAIEKKKGISYVKGIVYKKNGKVLGTEKRPANCDLDSLPFPDYTAFDSYEGKMAEYPILTSRGCPFACVFCINPYLGDKKWRTRSPANIIEEMKSAKEKYGFERLVVWDDNFTLDRERAKDIAERIIASGLKIEYALRNGVRADRLDEELLEIMKRSGCAHMSIGIENGDPLTFENVRKGETLEDIEKAVKMIKKVGIGFSGSMIIGLIKTDYASIERSMAFVKRLGVNVVWYPAIPFKHTELYEWVEKNGTFLTHDYEKSIWGEDPPIMFETKEFTKEERLKAYYIANLRSKNYFFVADRSKGLLSVFMKVAALTWKYDRKRMPLYMLEMSAHILPRALLNRLD